MFGYVKAEIPELRVREKEYYRAIYCGLCRAQGKCTGQCSRMTLSYDVAFLASVRMAVMNNYPEFKRGRCIVHPIKKHPYAVMNAELEYCAYATAILSYGKCLDDIEDEKGKKRFLAKTVRPFMSHARKKALKAKKSKLSSCGYPYEKLQELDAFIRGKLAELSDFEQYSNIASVDIPADIFGQMLSEIAAFGTHGNQEKMLRSIGYNLGKWIYMVDAADDCEEDKERGRFNPFLKIYDGEPPTDEQRRVVADAMKVQLSALEPAFDLIDYDTNRDMQGIINNILYLGMPKSASDALKLTDSCEKKKSKK